MHIEVIKRRKWLVYYDLLESWSSSVYTLPSLNMSTPKIVFILIDGLEPPPLPRPLFLKLNDRNMFILRLDIKKTTKIYLTLGEKLVWSVLTDKDTRKCKHHSVYVSGNDTCSLIMRVLCSIHVNSFTLLYWMP